MRKFANLIQSDRLYNCCLSFCNYKLAIEVDELGHSDSNIAYKIEIQKAI